MLPLAGLLLFAACASEDTADNRQQEPDTKGLTAFSLEENSTPPTTRVVGEYTGTGVKFYWTERDRLFVNNPTATSEWRVDVTNNIYELGHAAGTGRTPTAKFWFNGTFTEPEYRVRFMGCNNSTYPDKVTIPNTQNYMGPNVKKPADLQMGDCATGIAHRQPDGRYTFMLDHKASYVTIKPYSTQEAVTKGTIRMITLSADQALCGTFDFKNDTIDLSSRPISDQYKSVRTPGLTSSLFNIPSEITASSPYIIMAIAPGTYTNFTIQYSVWDGLTNEEGTITRTYPKVTFTAGKNKLISQDLHVDEYPGNEYYMWDAVEHLWKGYEWDGTNPEQPHPSIPNHHYSENIPKDNTDARWYNEVQSYADPTGAAPAVVATHSSAAYPNVNELCWYVKRGVPHYDREMWAAMGRLYSGRVWFRKLSVIAQNENKTVAELKEKAPDGTDYTRSLNKAEADIHGGLSDGRPSDIENYFCLPLTGSYGTLVGGNPAQYFLNGIGNYGHYWSSTPFTLSTEPTVKRAYSLYLQSIGADQYIQVSYDNRSQGDYGRWPADR
ncbi:hypothetical protein HMPREF0663_11517 [Hoylesella oralis ATCC 33269]|uniref:Uncharacterized protein n=2 Tax=Hoylesella oralis TaxID=28134 RepID=E7RQR6_9BACT|nr:hypothetical protein HMPREF0663_11517 [Hoylesella oralis ATCC 33269]